MLCSNSIPKCAEGCSTTFGPSRSEWRGQQAPILSCTGIFCARQPAFLSRRRSSADAPHGGIRLGCRLYQIMRFLQRIYSLVPLKCTENVPAMRPMYCMEHNSSDAVQLFMRTSQATQQPGSKRGCATEPFGLPNAFPAMPHVIKPPAPDHNTGAKVRIPAPAPSSPFGTLPTGFSASLQHAATRDNGGSQLPGELPRIILSGRPPHLRRSTLHPSIAPLPAVR